MTTFAAKLAARPDADRVRLRIGTTFIENVHTLWPYGPPEEVTSDFIRANTDTIIETLEKMFLIDDQGRAHRHIPHRLLWVQSLLAELNYNDNDNTV